MTRHPKSHRDEHHDSPPGAARAFREYFGGHGPWRGWTGRVRGGPATLWILGLALALVISLAWGIGQQQARAAAENELEMGRQRAFEQLVSRTQTIEVLLAKGLVTSAGGAGSLAFADLWHHGLAAQEDLTELPLDHAAIANSVRLMTQVADFGRYLVRQCVLGRPLGDEDLATLAVMHEAVATLGVELSELAGLIAGGGFRWTALDDGATRRAGEVAGRVRDGFGDIAERMQELPTLIYDGPFSDHIDQREPRGLAADEVTVEQALEIARRFAPALPGAAEGAADVIHIGEAAGRIPAYSFAINPAGAQPSPSATTRGRTRPDMLAAGPEVRIDVTRQGGAVTYMLVYGLEGIDGGDPEQFPGLTAWSKRIPVVSKLLRQVLSLVGARSPAQEAPEQVPIQETPGPAQDPAPGPPQEPGQVPAPVPWPTPEQQLPSDQFPPAEPGAPGPPGVSEPPPQDQTPQEQLPPGGPPGPDGLSLAAAVEHARDFLARRGFENMMATFTDLEYGVATCQFVAMQDGVLLYPDQVKVKVRLGDGQILGFEGVDYLMSHVPRELPEPAVTAAEARAMINPRLEVIGERLTLIPTPALGEVLCWELHVLYQGGAFLVYINAMTGDEEAIFKLIDRGQGSQLVM